LGALTLRIAYERWSEATDGEEFGTVARRTLIEVQAAGAVCVDRR
ncbi:MAG: TetR/AcrR family transcriptional regulator, partial [Nocardia sp.]|nr:TetR/AcrR family transcriptional regulator [Nocardia sp.]